MEKDTTHIQSDFLKNVREGLPANISFVDEIADILEVSKDSAYRRIRGETYLTINEIHKLCAHYKISLDKLLSPTVESISFNYQKVIHEPYNMEKWLGSILQNLEMIASLPEKELIYFAKDIPIFYYFKFRKLAAFKIFFWRDILLADVPVAPFNEQMIANEVFSIGERIFRKYELIDSTEIWSEESPSITIKQLEYCYDCGYLSSYAEYQNLLTEYKQLLESLKGFATTGCKDGDGKYILYKNDIILADNTILFKMADRFVVYKTHNTYNILRTSDEPICQDTWNYFEKLKSRSTLISVSGEKERNKLFSHYFKIIDNLVNPERLAEA